MGGSIAVTIREVNGAEHRMCRWTNATPNFVKSFKTWKHDSRHIEDYVRTWREMREDWETHRDTGKFVHPMTEVYAQHPYLAPCEYGLLIVDHQSNSILSCQGYTRYDRFYYGMLLSDMRSWRQAGNLVMFPGGEVPDPKAAFFDDDQPDSCRVIRDWCDAGKVTWEFPSGHKSRYQVTAEALWSACDRVWDDRGSPEYHSDLKLDWSPWRCVAYPETLAGWQEFSNEINLLGFSLDAQEKALWAEWFQDMSEEE